MSTRAILGAALLVTAAATAAILIEARASGIDNPNDPQNLNCFGDGICNFVPGGVTGSEVLANSGNTELLADPTNAFILTMSGSPPPPSSSCGTPVSIDSGGTNTITTTADAPVGSTVIVLVATGGVSVGFTGGLDSAGNSYSVAASVTGVTGYDSAILYSVNTANDLPSGGTITMTHTGTGNLFGNAYKVSDATGGLDLTNTTNSAGETTFSLTTGTLARAHEIAIGEFNNSATISTYAGGSGFTDVATFNTFAGVSAAQFELTDSTSGPTWSPSWTPSTGASAVIATLKCTS